MKINEGASGNQFAAVKSPFCRAGCFGVYFRMAVFPILGQRMFCLGFLLWKDAPHSTAIHFLPPLRDKGLPSLALTLQVWLYSVDLASGGCQQCLLSFAGLSHAISPNLSAWLWLFLLPPCSLYKYQPPRFSGFFPLGDIPAGEEEQNSVYSPLITQLS